MTNIGLSESKIPEKKSQFKKLLKRLTDKHYDNLCAKAIEEQRDHSLRAYPEFTTSSKPQSYLSGVKDRKILTKFRLGDAGLGNRSNAPIKLCPMCKTGENTEPHLVFECPEVQNIRDQMGPSFNLPKYLTSIVKITDSKGKLQHFLSGIGTNLGELQKRAEFLEALTNHQNEILTKSNINPLTDKPLEILSEKCLLCDFTSHTTQGIKIHKGKMHKNNK